MAESDPHQWAHCWAMSAECRTPRIPAGSDKVGGRCYGSVPDREPVLEKAPAWGTQDEPRLGDLCRLSLGPGFCLAFQAGEPRIRNAFGGCVPVFVQRAACDC